MDNISRRGAVGLVAGIVAALLAASAPSPASEAAPLGLKGYDPVAYFTQKRPMLGEAQYQHEWDGVAYRFASAQHLELFKAEPDRYLPQFNNLCAASVAKGVIAEGHPEHWLVVDGRLYLFGGPQGPGLMAADRTMGRRADDTYARLSQRPAPVRP